MPCPTCDHTMHNLGVPQKSIFWCPRCGTIKDEHAVTERPSWLRRVSEIANLGPSVISTFQANSVKAIFHVRRRDLGAESIELEINDAAGRRVV